MVSQMKIDKGIESRNKTESGRKLLADVTLFTMDKRLINLILNYPIISTQMKLSISINEVILFFKS